MLSDEEKILIKKLGYCEQEYEQNGYLSVGKFEAIKEAINLIEKQQKEIELLKEENEKYKNPPFFDEDEYTENDKIKAKIEEYKKLINECPMNDEEIFCKECTEKCGFNQTIDVLQSLLEKE